MKVTNTNTAAIVVGAREIAPGADIELTADEAKMSGVQALIAEGALVEAKGKADKGAADK